MAEDNKVITDGGVLGKVYLGEVLGRIYHVWCKHHSSQGWLYDTVYEIKIKIVDGH